MEQEKDLICAKVHWCVYVRDTCLLSGMILLGLMLNLMYLLYIGVAVGIACFLLTALKYSNQKLAVTRRKVYGVYGKGFLNLDRQNLNMPLDKIDNSAYKSDFMGSIFGYATIYIQSNRVTLRFDKIANYKEVIKVMEDARDEYNIRGDRMLASSVNGITGVLEQNGQIQMQMMQAQTMAQMKMMEMLAGNQQSQTSGAAAGIAQASNKALLDNAIEGNQTVGELENSDNIEEDVQRNNCLDGVARRIVRKKYEYPMWQKECPLVITNCFIAETNHNKIIDLNMEFCNLSQKKIIAIYVDIKGYNVLREQKCDMREVSFLDLDIKQGQKEASIQPIDLPDNTIRSVEIYVRHIVFDDESIWNYDGESPLGLAEVVQETIPQIYEADIRVIAHERLAHKTLGEKYVFYPLEEKDYWMCSCGQFNTGLICVNCDEDKEAIFKNFSKENIESIYSTRKIKEEEEFKQRKLRLEEERIRREEEERLRQEKEAAEKAAKEAARRERIENIKRAVGKTVIKTKEKATVVANGLNSEMQQHSQNHIKMVSQFCPECGRQNPDGAIYCAECGKRINGTQE